MKVIITSPVNHDGKSLLEGDSADMPETQAQALIDAGVAVAVGRKARSSTKTDEQLAAEAAAAAADEAAQAEAALAANQGLGA